MHFKYIDADLVKLWMGSAEVWPNAIGEWALRFEMHKT